MMKLDNTKFQNRTSIAICRNHNQSAYLPNNHFANEKILSSYDEKKFEKIENATSVKIYSELSDGYRFFNERLFNGELPDVIFTLTRRKSCLGYFAGGEFNHVRSKMQLMDEIAMNSMYIPLRTDEETWSTVVHEMCHVWQYHFSKYPNRRKKRRAYHDKEWGGMMENIGLIPSSTGKPGGKKTGNRVSHYIVPGGRFQTACHELIASGLTISWRERENPKLKAALQKHKTFKKDRSKTPFKCPKCNQRAWANHTALIACERPKCGHASMLKQI